MIGTAGVISVLLYFVITQHKKINQKKERKWIYGFVLLTAGSSIILAIPYSLNGLSEYLITNIGSLTKMVVS
ncbi:hypothetical protein KO561_06665 [Radiobacillus kanasensis]|uniref:hypothetical protein n=1 Tax=Radiobacillus kanasensis TaxID=2844358 RepID=UPI001E344B59|nr:hypothetical protein [Radiobacillus kanasensis]UFU00613.1 hypothetical protein KO561_06665 [Radiobacillus kanasensis]